MTLGSLERGPALAAAPRYPWPKPGVLEATRAAHHPNCVICGVDNPRGLQLDFRARAPGRVAARLWCVQALRSYRDLLHGGVTAAVLDDAMANCLFSIGAAGVTGELTVRYLAPVRLDVAADVYAELTRVCEPMYYLTAELCQAGTIMAQAGAKFVDLQWATGEPPGGVRRARAPS